MLLENLAAYPRLAVVRSLTLAAYNAGPGIVDRWLEDASLIREDGSRIVIGYGLKEAGDGLYEWYEVYLYKKQTAQVSFEMVKETVIKDIDDYLAKIPGAIKDSIAAIEPEKPAVTVPQFTAVSVSNDAVAALAVLALINAIKVR